MADSEQGREIRLALVMNGGVSLAVWMGGVTHEVAMLCGASRGQEPPRGTKEAERLLHEKWAQLLKRTRKTVIVDIVAGTSAGGLNGTLLATSLARGAPLTGLKDVWRQAGAVRVGALLPEAEASGLDAIFDGGFFTKKVSETLGSIAASEVTEVAEPQPDRHPVTLFVTATALRGDPREFRDSRQTSFAVPDHGRLYRFRYSPAVWEFQGWNGERPNFTQTRPPSDFNQSGESSPLAIAARASAGFPFAFPPIAETQGMLPLRIRPSASADLGQLMDGGILDNAPFAPILEEIAERPVDGPWSRYLCYVVPSTGMISRTQGRPLPQPPPWTEIAKSVIDYPREADFRTDIDQLERMLGSTRAVEQPLDLFSRLLLDTAGPDGVPDDIRQAAMQLRRSYIWRGAVAGLLALRERFAEKSAVTYLAPPPTVDASSILATEPFWLPPQDGAGTLPWAWGFAAAERSLRLMLRNLQGRLEDAEAVAPVSDALMKVGVLRTRFDSDWTTLVETLAGNPGPYGVPTELILDSVAKVADDLRVRDALSSLVDDAATGCAGAWQRTPAQVVADALTVEVLTRSTRGRNVSSPPRFSFVRIGPDAATPLVSGVADVGGGKLYGSRLNHFGSFGRDAWRDWDWLWGRLDGCSQFAQIIGATQDEITEMQELILKIEGVELPELQRRFEQVSSLTGRDLIDEIRRDPAGRRDLRNLLQTVLRFAWGPEPSTLPTFARDGGRMLHVVFAEQPLGSAGAKASAARFFLRKERKKLWTFVSTKPRAQGADHRRGVLKRAGSWILRKVAGG